jgi:hypothetical protein
MPAKRVQVGSIPINGLLIGTAWVALWLRARGPYRRCRDHGRWTEIGVAAARCREVTCYCAVSCTSAGGR